MGLANEHTDRYRVSRILPGVPEVARLFQLSTLGGQLSLWPLLCAEQQFRHPASEAPEERNLPTDFQRQCPARPAARCERRQRVAHGLGLPVRTLHPHESSGGFAPNRTVNGSFFWTDLIFVHRRLAGKALMNAGGGGFVSGSWEVDPPERNSRHVRLRTVFPRQSAKNLTFWLRAVLVM